MENFNSFIENSFIELDCSPKQPNADTPEFLFNMPSEVEWGGLLPICAFHPLTVGMNKRNFYSYIQIKRISPTPPLLINDYSLELGKPFFYDVMLINNLFEKNNYLYFNVNGFREQCIPPPGEYTVSLSSSFGLKSQPQKLLVRPGGWRYELSKSLFTEICENRLFQNMKEYFSFISIPMKPVDGERYYIKLNELWHRGFKPHEKILTPQILEKIRQEGVQDVSIGQYVQILLQQNCKYLDTLQKENEHFFLRIDNIWSGIRQYQISPEPEDILNSGDLFEPRK